MAKLEGVSPKGSVRGGFIFDAAGVDQFEAILPGSQQGAAVAIICLIG